MKDSWAHKPASAMRTPKRPRPADAQATEDMQDAADQAEIQAKAAKKAQDSIGEMFSGSWFITNWTDPILNVPEMGPQMSVSRFYPEAWVAVDIFTHIGPWEERVIALKRKLFKENDATFGGTKHRVKYGALQWSDDLASLLPQLGG